MKRFYKEASLSSETDRGYQILLDGRAVKTPLKSDLFIEHEKIARKIRDEWAGQSEQIKPDSMPYMSLYATIIDKVSPVRAEIIEQVAGYVDGDVILYFNEEDQDFLAQQRQHWHPLLSSAETSYGLRYQIETGFLPNGQSHDIHEKWHDFFRSLSNEKLGAFQYGVSITASPLLIRFLLDQKLDAKRVFELAFLEELFQKDQWGVEAEAEKRRQGKLEELVFLKEFIDLLIQAEQHRSP